MSRRFPRIHLWQLFALVTFAALLAWIWPRLGIDIFRHPAHGSKVDIYWEDRSFRIYDSRPTVRKRRMEQKMKEAAERNARLDSLTRKREQAEEEWWNELWEASENSTDSP